MSNKDNSVKITCTETMINWPGLLSVDLTAKFLSIGKTLLYQLDLSGRIPEAIHLQGRKLWRRCELEQWIALGCPPRDQWKHVSISKDENH